MRANPSDIFFCEDIAGMSGHIRVTNTFIFERTHAKQEIIIFICPDLVMNF